MGSMADTHEVTNQVPPLIGYNPSTSPALSEALVREGGGWGVDEVSALGAIAGTARAQHWGELADRNEPVLRTHDRYGHRIDEVEYDPAYPPADGWSRSPHGLHGGPVGRRAGGVPTSCAPPSSASGKTSRRAPVCPISMTYAVVPRCDTNPDLGGPIYEPLPELSHLRSDPVGPVRPRPG